MKRLARLLYILLSFLLAELNCSAQFTMSGATTVCADGQNSYTYIVQPDVMSGCEMTTVEWQISGGEVISGQFTNVATIRWNSEHEGYYFLSANVVDNCCPSSSPCNVSLNMSNFIINYKPIFSQTVANVFKNSNGVGTFRFYHLDRSDFTPSKTLVDTLFESVTLTCQTPTCTLSTSARTIHPNNFESLINCQPVNNISQVFTLRVFGKPKITANGYAYESSPVTLSVTPNYGSSASLYEWYRNGDFVQSTTTPNITTNQVGRYWVKVSLANSSYQLSTISSISDTIIVGARQLIVPNSLSSNRNYIVTNKYTKPIAQIPADGYIDQEGLIQDVTYLDGLGRVIQSHAIAHTINRRNLIQNIEYDQEGTIKIQRLPLIDIVNQNSNSAPYITNFISTQEHFYQNYTDGVLPNYKPFKSISYDRSPFSRATKTDLASAAYSLASNRNDSVRIVRFNPGTGSTVVWRGVYSSITRRAMFNNSYLSNELIVHEYLDAQRNISRKYYDLNGKLIIEEGRDGGRTQYVYDEFNRIVRIFQPQAIFKLNNNWNETGVDSNYLKEYCTRFVYNEEGLVIEEHKPSLSKPHRTVYYKNGLTAFFQRPIQDTLINGKRSYNFLIYDVQGRIVTTGEFLTNINSIQVQNSINSSIYTEVVSRYVNSQAQYHGYTILNSNYRPGSQTIQRADAVFHYDDYDSDRDHNTPPIGVDSTNRNTAINTSGLRTITAVRALSGLNTDLGWYNNVSLYDSVGRVILNLQLSNHITAKLERTHDQYGRVTKIEKSVRKPLPHNAQSSSNLTYTTVQLNENLWYDRDKLISNGYTRKHYNDLGNLTRNRLLFSDRVHDINYTYTELGQIKKISSTHFYQEYFYETPFPGAQHLSPGRFDGKISATSTSFPTLSPNPVEHNWHYNYDSGGRLIDARYTTTNPTNRAVLNNLDQYRESFTYSTAGGEINRIQRRYSDQLVDDITLHRNWSTPSSRIRNAQDVATDGAPFKSEFRDNSFESSAAQEFFYDAEGSITQNYNANDVRLTYNRLGLVDGISRTLMNGPGGTGVRLTLHYIYDGLGQRLMERLITQPLNSSGQPSGQDSVRHEYYAFGELVLRSTDPSVYKNSDNKLIYLIHDHLGTPRVVMNFDAQVLERNFYYPGGLRIAALSSTQVGSEPTQDGWASGQRSPEWSEFYGQLHGRRYLDPALGQFYGVEPLAAQYADMSVYAYAANDPVNLFDPTGNDVVAPGGQWSHMSLEALQSSSLAERSQTSWAQFYFGAGGGRGIGWLNSDNTNPFGSGGGPGWETIGEYLVTEGITLVYDYSYVSVNENSKLSRTWFFTAYFSQSTTYVETTRRVKYLTSSMERIANFYNSEKVISESGSIQSIADANRANPTYHSAVNDGLFGFANAMGVMSLTMEQDVARLQAMGRPNAAALKALNAQNAALKVLRVGGVATGVVSMFIDGINPDLSLAKKVLNIGVAGAGIVAGLAGGAAASPFVLGAAAAYFILDITGVIPDDLKFHQIVSPLYAPAVLSVTQGKY